MSRFREEAYDESSDSVSVDAGASSSRRGRASPVPWLRDIRILIVEDDTDSRDLLRQMVASFGATVRVAAGGQEALTVASAWTPDLILADLLMPGIDGFALLSRLRDDPRLNGVRVVAVSALATGADIKRTLLAGFDGHVAKPIDYDLVATLIERLFWAHPLK